MMRVSRQPSDRDHLLTKISRPMMRVSRQPSDCDHLLTKISRPIVWCESSVDADRELLRMPRGARYVVRSRHLNALFSTCLDLWSRGLGSTRSLPLSRNPTLLRPPRVLQNRQTVWEHSPTRKIKKIAAPINEGAVNAYCVTAPKI